MSEDETTQLGTKPASSVGPGTQLNGIYEIDELIASGGMGEVYRGHNIRNKTSVAIKIILPEFANDETVLSLFERESDTLNHLSHDAIVRYHLFGLDPAIERPYLSMEFVDGTALGDHIKENPLTLADTVKLLIRVCEGLAAAHEAGVIHRDLSPDNVILPGDKVKKAKIIDFGIAKSTASGHSTLLGGKFAGKYNFVSPEQLGRFDGIVTERSDIYSLGLVAVAALRGTALDMGGSHVEVIEKRSSVPDIGDVDERIRPLLEMMLEPDPDKRPESMKTIVEWLKSMPSTDAPPVAAGDAVTMIAQTPPGTAEGPSVAQADITGQNLPPHSQTPQSVAPQSMPPHSQTPQSVAPQSMPPHSQTPQSVALQSMPPHSQTPQSVAPQSMPPHSQAPQSVAPQSMPLQSQAPQPIAEVSQTPQPTPPTGPETTSTSVAPSAVESPFGPAASHEIPVPITPPPEPVYVPKKKSSRSGLYALIALLLLAGAGGAAYFLTQGSDDAPDQVAVTKNPPSVVTDPPDSKPPDPPSTVEQKDGPDQDTKPTEKETEPTDKQTEEISKPIDVVASRIDWLQKYDGGKCFFAAAQTVSEEKVEIEGFSTSTRPFERMMNEFREAHGLEPDIGVRLIRTQQCAVPEFLQEVRGIAGGKPVELVLSSDLIRSGEAIKGGMSGIKDRISGLLLVDTDGFVHNLDIPGITNKTDSLLSFAVQPSMNTAVAVPQLVMGITSNVELKTIKPLEPQAADRIFPQILEEIRKKGAIISTDTQFFRIGGN